MRRPRQHLLRVEQPVEAFVELIAAARDAGARAGWLELSAPSPLPPSLEAAAERGVLRAVAVGGGRAAAVKPLRGEPVLRDLLREHFRGCSVVLVRGEVEAPRLKPAAGGWEVTAPGTAPRHLTTWELLAALRKPRPWSSDGEATKARGE